MGNTTTLMQKVGACLTKFEEWFLILGVLAMGIVMTCQVFSRAIFKHSIVWSEECVRHIFIWTIFIGMSYGIARLLHVRLEYLVDMLPLAFRKAVSIAMDAAVVILLAYLFIPSIEYAHDQMRLLAPTMGYPMGYVMLAMPVSIILTIFRLLMDMARIAKMKEAGI